MRRTAIVAALLLGVVGTLHAYTPSASGTGVTPVFQRWFNIQTSYLVNDQTTASLPNMAAGSDPLTAVARGFQAWEDVGPATIIANFAGLTQITNAASDGNNVVSFVDQSFSFNGALAVTLRFINPSTGQVGSADIIFNPNISWSTRDPGQGVFDVQQVGTHEAGHFFALDHSGLMNATMYATSGSQAQFERRLDPDDIAGLSDTYPRDSLTTDYGTITGRVTRLGANVFGGQVVAVELGSGRPVVSALTLRDGTYQIRGVPPGSYQLYVEPLDQPTSQGNVAGYWQSQTFTLFQSTIHGPLIEIEAGETGGRRRHRRAESGAGTEPAPDRSARARWRHPGDELADPDPPG